MFITKKVPKDLNNYRIDIILKELNLVDSRNKAMALIMSGNVFVDDKKIIKPGQTIKSNKIVKLKKNDHDWVSRGGIKLNKALEVFDIDVSKKVCLDIGCSTGGFTDVLIDKGVKKVYAVDVGYGQFDWNLRNSDKVILLERTNARELDNQIIPELIDLVVCDVSFISLKKVILPVKKLLKRNFKIISLIKPQFEVNKKYVGKGGIIKNPDIHSKVCQDIDDWFKKKFQYKYTQTIESPILGQKGNKEFFIFVRN